METSLGEIDLSPQPDGNGSYKYVAQGNFESPVAMYKDGEYVGLAINYTARGIESLRSLIKIR